MTEDEVVLHFFQIDGDFYNFCVFFIYFYILYGCILYSNSLLAEIFED